MKTYLKLSIVFLFGLLMGSCNEYLDVKPEDKYLEEQVYSSEEGINNLLNGVYINLAENNLYGGQLTMSTVELLAQRYNVSNANHDWYDHGHYLYDETSVRASFEGIWTSAYEVVINLNSLLEGIEKYSTLPEWKKNIIKGEALGLRAMIQFDLLRLFGPVYLTNASDLSIPYYTEAKAEANSFLPATDVVNMVLSDLNEAETLLENDPIITNGIVEDPEQPFYSFRNLRLNYYGIKALQARVHLYAGNTQEALTTAQFVIDETSGLLPWTEPSAVISSDNRDRVFSSEIIFAVQNLSLYTRHNNLFSNNLTDAKILAPNTTRIEQVFESNESDYRFNSSWVVPSDGVRSYRTFTKYADVTDKDLSFRFMQPIVRKTEMYYIVAETTPDVALAKQYLDEVRYNRGLVALDEDVDISEEIRKEYMKEFYGEGQLFFYYKRNNIEAIPDGNSTSSSRTVSMGVENYVVPIPESETKFQ
ncbi:RagB/SusD family nutrient uptake outer membrane protein [Joostella sp. CR20]|uniref:RagB/SusD family nutrient uptake outer membrane protein n=1 Tax=Joostella sp. CR20 TaxID=2804312 RepID=UPI00313D1E0A